MSIVRGHLSATILIHLSPQEHARLKQRVLSCAVPVSEDARRCAVERELTARVDVAA